jgi:hypothetical protein
VESAKAAGVHIPTYKTTLAMVTLEALHLLEGQLSSVPYRLAGGHKIGDGDLVHQFGIDMDPGESMSASTLDEFSQRFIAPAMAGIAAKVNQKDVRMFGELQLPAYVESVYRATSKKSGVSIRAVADTRIDHITGEFRSLLRFDVVCG